MRRRAAGGRPVSPLRRRRLLHLGAAGATAAWAGRAGAQGAAARQLFDLTDAEAKFSSALASGSSLTEAAEAQGVRISTARTHLARIFQKTHTRQQSQLVYLLRSAALPLRGR